MNQNEKPAESIAGGDQLLRTLIDNLPDYIFVKDAQSRFLLNNQAHIRALGATRQEEVLGKTDFDCFPAERASQYFADEQILLQSGQTLNREEIAVDQSTSVTHWMEVTKAPVRNTVGQIVGLVGIARDITARKQAEETLRQGHDELEQRVAERTAELSQERLLLRTLIDNLPDCIYAKDTAGRKTLTNPADLKIFGGQTEGEAIGKSDFDLFPPEIAARFVADDQQVIQGQPIINREEFFFDKAGQKHWLLTSKLPLRDQNGKIAGLIGIGRDITERRQSEEKLEALHKQMLILARQAGMAETATSVLHNVGNVLNSVNVSATMLRDGIQKSKIASLAKLSALLSEHTADLGPFLTTDPRGQQVPDYLHQLTDRLAAEQAGWMKEVEILYLNIEHINKIIALQQAYAGVAGIAETVALSELVDDALRIHEQAYVRHVVRVVRDYTPVQSISVDKHKVLQIVVNLLHNAKYACDAAGQADKVVTVRIGPAGPERVRIEVTDNGVGIDPEYLTKIFLLGYTTRKGGHGFGLHSGAIGAKEMGGALSAHSAGPGQGASFVLELPLHPPAPKSAAGEQH
jgi:PAS domain S-box-containing protein